MTIHFRRAVASEAKPLRVAQYYRKANVGGRLIGEHVAIAQAALGKPMPSGAVVHHIDEDKHNNATSNLVICPDENYHRLLHRRMRAVSACGHADWLKCWICKRWDDRASLAVYGRQPAHRLCINARMRRVRGSE